MDSDRFDRLAKGFASSKSRRSLLKGFGVAAIGGAFGFAGRKGAEAKGAKVGICHVTGSGRQEYISVSASAVPAHLAHGDTVTDLTDIGNCGSCGNACDDGNSCTTNSCVSGQCVYTNNPVDCVVSDWSEWGACSVDCGGGTQTRTRTVITEASCGGAACPNLVEEQECNTQFCDICDAGPGPCGNGGACLDGDCFLAYPNCPGSYGVAANGGGVNPCVCSGGSQAVCDTTGACADGEVCILLFEGSGYVGHCFGGCPA